MIQLQQHILPRVKVFSSWDITRQMGMTKTDWTVLITSHFTMILFFPSSYSYHSIFLFVVFLILPFLLYKLNLISSGMCDLYLTYSFSLWIAHSASHLVYMCMYSQSQPSGHLHLTLESHEPRATSAYFLFHCCPYILCCHIKIERKATECYRNQTTTLSLHMGS